MRLLESRGAGTKQDVLQSIPNPDELFVPKLHAHEPVNDMIEEFFYYLMSFRDADGYLAHVKQTGESIPIVLRNSTP